jgi:hypothetical protein
MERIYIVKSHDAKILLVYLLDASDVGDRFCFPARALAQPVVDIASSSVLTKLNNLDNLKLYLALG